MCQMRSLPRVPAYLCVAGLAFAASATSLGNGFALDDLALIATNARVHSLHEWWRLFSTPYWPAQFGQSLYRPIVTLGYAVQWTVGNGAPWVFHAVSVAMYMGVCVLAFALFRRVLPPVPAVIAGALFAVHPVHVEAVANVVGQAELIAAVAILAACVTYVRARDAGTPTVLDLATIAVLFGVACLAKEHALLLPVLFGLLEIFAVRGAHTPPADLRKRVGALTPLGVTLAIVGIAFLAARTLTLGELLGEKPLVPVAGFSRVLVMFAVAPHWIRLFFWPAHLSADYSPHHISIPTTVDVAVGAGIAVFVAAIAAFIALGTSKISAADQRAGRLAIAWTAVTLLPVSNLFSVMLVAERTLLVPSVGAMLLVGAVTSMAFAHADSINRRGLVRFAFALGTAVVGVVGIIRSRERQHVWRDDATLFAQTVLDAPESYRAQFFYGQSLFESGRRREGEKHVRLAIQLNPTRADVSPLNYLATQYRDAGMCPAALPLYEQAIANDSARPDVRYGLAACLLNTGRVADGKRLAQDGVRRGDLKGLFEQLIAHADSVTAPAR
jgi:hypothetical protein